jgi:hypothetical protein
VTRLEALTTSSGGNLGVESTTSGSVPLNSSEVDQLPWRKKRVCSARQWSASSKGTDGFDKVVVASNDVDFLSWRYLGTERLELLALFFGVRHSQLWLAGGPNRKSTSPFAGWIVKRQQLDQCVKGLYQSHYLSLYYV